MFEAMVEWMGHPLYYTHFSGRAPKRSGPDHATIVPYGRFRAGDGKHVMLGIQNEREWAAFCRGVLKRPELATDARYDNNTKRTAARAEVVALIERVFADMTAEQVVERLDAAGIANARLNTPDEVWDHAQLKARDRWREVESPAGRIPAILPPASFQGIEARMDAIPSIGEHTDRFRRGKKASPPPPLVLEPAPPRFGTRAGGFLREGDELLAQFLRHGQVPDALPIAPHAWHRSARRRDTGAGPRSNTRWVSRSGSQPAARAAKATGPGRARAT